jgi:hypothetical protein
VSWLCLTQTQALLACPTFCKFAFGAQELIAASDALERAMGAHQ